MPRPQQALSPELLEKYAQQLWQGGPQMPDPSMWQKIKEALPEQGDILKGISHVQEAGETAKLLWQIANYNPQYKIETQGDTHLRMPRGGGYYY